jgi:hypothetical protein
MLELLPGAEKEGRSINDRYTKIGVEEIESLLHSPEAAHFVKQKHAIMPILTLGEKVKVGRKRNTYILHQIHIWGGIGHTTVKMQ